MPRKKKKPVPIGDPNDMVEQGQAKTGTWWPVGGGTNNELACAIHDLHKWLASHYDLEKELEKLKDELLKAILKTESNIMSKISEFATKQNTFNDRVDAAVTGLQQDIKTLNDLIEQLQNSPGEITPEDQASLNALEARGDAIAAKLEALDALTPPPVPSGSGDGGQT